MRIKIEVDVRPEELRRFLGLPDVAGLQEDFIQFLRVKLEQATEHFDPVGFIRDNLKTFGRGSSLLKLLASAHNPAEGKPAATADDATPVESVAPETPVKEKVTRRKRAAPISKPAPLSPKQGAGPRKASGQASTKKRARKKLERDG